MFLKCSLKSKWKIPTNVDLKFIEVPRSKPCVEFLAYANEPSQMSLSTRGAIVWSHKWRQNPSFGCWTSHNTKPVGFGEMKSVVSIGLIQWNMFEDLMEGATWKMSRYAKIIMWWLVNIDDRWPSSYWMIDEEDKEVARDFLSLSKFRNPSRAESSSYGSACHW